MQAPQSTNSLLTSAPLPSEPCETIDAICQTHGPYKAKLHPNIFNPSKPYVGGCLTCLAEKRAAEDERKERERQAEHNRTVNCLLADSMIPARFADRTLADYRATVPGQRMALGVCKAYAEAWPEKRASGASLVLTGSPGTGKTHLACAIASAAIREHLASVKFATVAKLLRFIKDTYRKDSERSEQQAINRLIDPDLLIVDEVGIQVGSEHEKLLMFEVLNARYQELRPTILISNLDGSELEAFLGHRIMDRYRECGAVLAFDWQSFRGQS